MILPGRVSNGVVILEGGPAPPEGAAVGVCYLPPVGPAPAMGRVQVPLVRTGRPGSLPLTGEQIAEVLDDDDALARR